MLTETLGKEVCCPLRIYVAGPLSGDSPGRIYRNVTTANWIAQEIFLRGHQPFCPHAMTHEWLGRSETDFHDYERVVECFDFAWLRCCDAIYLLPGWADSRGAQMEYKEAQRLGLWVFRALDEVPTIKPDSNGRWHLMNQRDEFSLICRRRLILGEKKHGDDWMTQDCLQEGMDEMPDGENWPFLEWLRLSRLRALRDKGDWPPRQEWVGYLGPAPRKGSTDA